MKLVIPFSVNGKVYSECEIGKPRASVIADTKRCIDETGDAFSAMRVMLNGCIESFGDVTDKVAIKALIPKMPLKTAEHLVLSVVTMHYADDDGIEGVYPCPRCGTQYIAEIRETDGMVVDTRDHISTLPVVYCDMADIEIMREFKTAVLIENKANGNVIYDINSITIAVPTLENAINAYAKIGARDMVRLQFAMYVEALKKINGEVVDNKFRNSFGMLVFENIRDARDDLGWIAEQINMYGTDREVKKTCKKCGKVWKATVSTSNFFVSGNL
jgi:hypothetical protein